MKLLSIVISSTIVSAVSLLLSTPLVILALSLVLVGNRFYRQALMIALFSGLLYSLLSLGEGLLGIGLFSLILLVAVTLAVAIKSIISGPMLFNLVMGVILIGLTHVIIFRRFFSPSLLFLIILYLVLYPLVPHITGLLRKPKHLKLDLS